MISAEFFNSPFCFTLVYLFALAFFI